MTKNDSNDLDSATSLKIKVNKFKGFMIFDIFNINSIISKNLAPKCRCRVNSLKMKLIWQMMEAT